jgi:hypothetical protein
MDCISGDVATDAPTKIMAPFEPSPVGVSYCALVEIGDLKLEYGQAANPGFVAIGYSPSAAGKRNRRLHPTRKALAD